MVKVQEQIEVEIRDLSSQGEGVGSYQGLTIFVEGALVSEKVLVKVDVVKKQYAKGRLTSILSPSPKRVFPICPAFEKCGGCQIMHLAYEEQLVIKEKRVRSAFERIGGFADVVVQPIRPSPRTLHYRNKITLPIVWQKGKGTMGLYAKRSHDVVPISHCYIHLEEGEKILTTLREHLPLADHVVIRTAEHSGESLVLLLVKKKGNFESLAKILMEKHSSIVGVVQGILPEEGNTLFAKYYVTVAGNNYLEERFSDYTVRVSAPSFFQVNTLQAEALYSAAIESAELQPEDVVLDAYSGIGLITMMMAKKVRKVMGIEVAPSSIRDAKHNAAAHQITNIDCFEGLTERWISRIPPYDKVLLNPPRGGCEIATLDAITKSRAKRIIYISCDPATLARDAAHLKAAGWHLHKVLPFDMFPQTMHVESIATFSR